MNPQQQEEIREQAIIRSFNRLLKHVEGDKQVAATLALATQVNELHGSLMRVEGTLRGIEQTVARTKNSV